MYALNATGITLAAADSITDFGPLDLISTGISGLTSAMVDIASGAFYKSFADFVDDANAVFTSGLGYQVCVSYDAQGSGNAWVAINNNGGVLFDSGDSLVVLTGINSAGQILASDFIA